MANVAEFYGKRVFNDHVMKERLPSVTYKNLAQTIKDGRPLDLEVANVVAHAMKEWAIEQGATHFTHWFQPLTGITSEKHDSFLNPQPDGRALMSFSGKELVQGEPDASSFPSGGLRATFEARGYTAWDPTSYAFIKDDVLCIPTAFCSYNGEALDKKTPLLRSMKVIDEQARRVLQLFGTDNGQVTTTLGPEQEYFLIKEEDYEARPDLILTGRTLFGADACKGQELEEHYFGAVRPTVSRFMKELDDELWMLGIPAKTKHNEVAPAQHELAPIYETTNVAIDSNLLTMEMMKKVASHHGLVCLQHEKPFEGVNGSGKHNNWSIGNAGANLLDPGKHPEDNLQFLVFLSAVVKAVDEYQDILRASIATAGNDHRLGGNEAPPAIVSMYLGDTLGGIVDAIINDREYEPSAANQMDLGVDVLPHFLKDNSDRNRTSPFAFTGNKFEFRMPGSAVNLSDTNVVLNVAVAEALKEFAEAVEGAPDFEAAAREQVSMTLKEHQRIIFNGNGYSEEWPKEAARRGLLNLESAVDALPSIIAEKNVALYEEFGILTKTELQSRYEVKLEQYSKLVNIEARTMLRMARQMYLPAVSDYAANVASIITAVKDACADASTMAEEKTLAKLSKGSDDIYILIQDLIDLVEKARYIENDLEQARCYHDEVLPKMSALRQVVDKLERIVDDEYWPVPSYNKMLFYV